MPPTESPLRRGWRLLASARTRALLSLGLLVGFGSIGTYAYWTDTAQVNTGTITSGRMDLQFDAGGAAGTGTAYSRGNITWNGLAPGERKAFNLQVNNVGNPPFTYTASVTRGTSPGWTYVGSPVTVQLFTGNAVPKNTYPQQDTCSGGAIGGVQTVDETNKQLITNPRSLTAGGNEGLCVIVGLASTATNDNQGKTGSLALNFSANQTP